MHYQDTYMIIMHLTNNNITIEPPLSEQLSAKTIYKECLELSSKLGVSIYSNKTVG